MASDPDSQPETASISPNFKTLPKVDLHRHLEGSLRWESVQALAVEAGVDLRREQVQILPGQPHTPDNLLAKFKVLRGLYRSAEIIRRVARLAVQDAAQDGVVHLELRFTPAALAQAGGFSLEGVMDWVVDACRAVSQDHSLSLRLIASANRHEGVELARRVAELALERLPDGIVALDLAGDEQRFPAKPFLPVFRLARERGLKICLHAGEWAGGENVLEAIRDFGAGRIAHGIHALDAPAALEAARESGVTFEVCPSSNVLSGAAMGYTEHPLKAMLRAGLRATINTDNPGIQGIPLSREYELASQEMDLSQAEIKTCVMNAVEAAFLTPQERQGLLAKLNEVNW
jgi:adenosine deaminase